MKIKMILALLAIFSLGVIEARLKVLHITFHEGCMNDFREVAHELDLDLTSWFVQSLPENFWMGRPWNNSMYNINHEQATTVWERHKLFFQTFDVVLTSDTAPLSRIFLQNGWEKPLIIWVCNRFDYFDLPTYDRTFPDKEYYQLIRAATLKPNVFFASYTPFELVYAKNKQINWGNRIVKPLGKKEISGESQKSLIPRHIKKDETLFIFPRLSGFQIKKVGVHCLREGIKTWSGTYNGPEDIKNFKAILFFPYAFSNLALFENLQRGVVHFVPTAQFLKELGFIRRGMEGRLQWCEWYFKEYEPYIQYFDSWNELAKKVKEFDYSTCKKIIRQFGQRHRQLMLDEWHRLFAQVK